MPLSLLRLINSIKKWFSLSYSSCIGISLCFAKVSFFTGMQPTKCSTWQNSGKGFFMSLHGSGRAVPIFHQGPMPFSTECIMPIVIPQRIRTVLTIRKICLPWCGRQKTFTMIIFLLNWSRRKDFQRMFLIGINLTVLQIQWPSGWLGVLYMYWFMCSAFQYLNCPEPIGGCTSCCPFIS